MLRITQKSSGSDTTKYFFGYYAEQELDRPVWLGKGSDKLGLKGEILEKDFQSVCNNVCPKTGKQITDRMVQNRTSSYDFTFSVPKSISITYGIMEDKELLSSFDKAVRATMDDIEKSSEVRVRKNGKSENRNSGNLIYGIFTHGETRPIDGVSDPQLHKHVIVQNLSFDEVEKKWKAGQFRNIKADAPYYETLFRSHLANELTQVGYEIKRSKKDFEIARFDRELIDKFSRRTKEIEERSKELGLEYADDKAALGAKTRASKIEDVDRGKMKDEWKSRLTDKEYELIQNAKNSNNGDAKKVTHEQALEYSLAHTLERKSVVSEKELMVTGLKRSFGDVTPEQFRKTLNARKDLFSRVDKGEKIFTTKEALAEEKALISSAKKGMGKYKPIYKDYEIENKQLTSEQSNAVKSVLNSKDFIMAISGKAGVGKTYSIKEVANAVKEKGMPFVAVAPSSQASRVVQREEGFNNATTIADLLQNKKLQEELKGGLLWIDEITLVGNKTMNEIIDLSKRQNARIMLTGDNYQHTSTERGDSYRILQIYGGLKPARIDKIQRQRRDDYRTAVELISEGNVLDGYNQLDKMGAIKESESMEDFYHNAANEFVEAVKKKEHVLTVSTTHAQGRIFTEIVRSKMKEEKLLTGKEKSFNIQKNLNFTQAQKTDSNNYYEGQVIQFHQNIKGGIHRGSKYSVDSICENGEVFIKQIGAEGEVKKLPKTQTARFSVYQQQEINIAKGDLIRITQNGFTSDKKRLNNGNEFRVKGFDKNGNIIATSGKRNLTIDKSFGNLNFGYFNTSPSSQGKTVQKVILLQSSMSGKASNRQQFYVSVSRGKFSISIHTDDKELMLKNAKRSSERMTATELVDGKQDKAKLKMKEAFEMAKVRLRKIQQLKNQQITKRNVNHGRSTPSR